MTNSRTALTGWLLLSTVALWGCNGATNSDPESGGIVATVGEETITDAEVIEKLRTEQYDMLRSTVDAMASEMIVNKEAEARGMDVEELFRLEVSAKISLPDPREIEMFYETSKDSPTLRGKTLEEMRPTISNFLQRQKAIERRNAYMAELRRAAGIKVFLEPERVAVEIPAGAQTKGPDEAAIEILEFADFQCPSCRRAYADIERILAEYTGKIRYSFLDYPLSIHPRAVPASEAALCAADQAKFWDFHQHLMLFTGPLDDADLRQRAADMGLDVAQFETCYKNRQHSTTVQSTFRMGRTLGVDSTPTFFINGRKIVGAPPYETFKEIIEEELAKASGGEVEG